MFRYVLSSRDPFLGSRQVRKMLTSFPPVNDAESHRHPSVNKKLIIFVVVAICVVAFVTSKVVLTVILCKRKTNNNGICSQVNLSGGGKMVLFQALDNLCPSKTVLHKTEQLTKEDIIGSGGYGTVYKLVLEDGTSLAVKKLARGDIEKERGFERELETLGDLKHRNLVSLRGYYSAPHINLLFYVLMKNGSLDDWLHERPPGASRLSWPTRFKIALGAARGISYLHHDCIPHIIHRDIKSSNILLDETMEAHVSDFGLAKLMNPRETHVTTIIAGTLGYLAPEYVDMGKATLKGDVYSYGIVLLELVSGKRPTDEDFVEKGITLVAWVKALAESGCVEDAFAESLKDIRNNTEIIKTVDLALLCVSRDMNERPDMNQVVHMLEQIQAESENISTL